MDTVLQGAVQDLIMATAVAVVAVVGYFVKKGLTIGVAYLEQKIGADKVSIMRGEASSMVRYVEQSPVTKDLFGEAKKEAVLNALYQKANAINLPVTHEMLDQFVEEAVQIMNAELGKPWLDDGFDDEGASEGDTD